MEHLNLFFSTPLPARFRFGRVDFWGGRGPSGNEGAPGAVGGRGPSGNEGAPGAVGGRGPSGDSDSDSDSDGNDPTSGVEHDGWEGVERDKATGHPSAGGYETGTTGANTGEMGFSDMAGYGFVDSFSIGLDVAASTLADNVFGITRDVASTGLLGPYAQIASIAYNTFDAIQDKSFSVRDAVGLSTIALDPTPAAVVNAGLSITAPDTSMADHLSAAVFGAWGGKASGIMGALTGINMGHYLSNTLGRGLALTGSDSEMGTPTNAEMGFFQNTNDPSITAQGAPTDTGLVIAGNDTQHALANGPAEAISPVWDGFHWLNGDQPQNKGTLWDGKKWV